MLSSLLVLATVIFLDVLLSGDNAVVIGMAASTLPALKRNGALLFGMASAALARILLSLFAVSLLHYRLLAVVGGFVLLFVDGKLIQNIWRKAANREEEKTPPKAGKTFWATIGIIALADVSMSLDNILSVAAVARNNPFIMSIGLIFSIAAVGFGAKAISSIIDKRPWLNWAGVGLIGLVALELIFGISAL